MLFGRQHRALRTIASVIRQHEVVAEIDRISGPRNEVIEMAAASDRTAAVEALAVLHFPQHRTERLNIGALRAEQELGQVRRTPECRRVEFADVLEPRTPDEFRYQYMKAAKAEGNTGPEFDGVHPRTDGKVHIQEIEWLVADPLKPPQRLLPEDALNPIYECGPWTLIVPECWKRKPPYRSRACRTQLTTAACRSVFCVRITSPGEVGPGMYGTT